MAQWIRGHDLDDLYTADIGAVDGPDAVPHGTEGWPHHVIQWGLQAQQVGNLGVPLRLRVPAHQNYGHHRLLIAHQETGEDAVHPRHHVF
jgi:hypothetical protein